ncbi:hypothetical protein BDW59DRAFT_182191 [Aspergillus cavernicola]|uniref:C6 transcription factor n=1 Tax=Aspergillus cavernicola TaxID=176166 RepID=A0ABR4IV43_9EURO
MPKDGAPKEVTNEAMEEYALQAFFYDYCLAPINPTFSCGFLGGLEVMVHRLGRQSPVSKACQAVAFASHGLKLTRPFLTRKAEELYQSLLRSLAHAIKDPKMANKTDTAVMAILLGLYELMFLWMIIAGDTDPGHHSAHAGGLAALLQIKNNPLALLEAVRADRSLLPSKAQKPGIFSTCCHRGPGKDLDSLLLRLGPIYKTSQAILSPFALIDLPGLHSLKEEAEALNQELEMWQQTQSDDFKPTTVGHMTANPLQQNPQVGYWPGRIDIYFDFYIAAMWNISRTARCVLMDLILQLSNLLNDGLDHFQLHKDSLTQVEDIIASIPYHLTEHIQAFIRHQGPTMANPGRPTGGLLLMNPIYILSDLPIVPPEMQVYMKQCLAWIGHHMGIGHASLLAKNSDIDNEYTTSGCMIIWAALLV